MKWVFLFLMFVPFLAQAKCETYTRFGEPQTICWHKEFKARVSEQCLRNCEATAFLRKKNKRPEKIDRTGGKNPATQYCKAFELKVHVLKDPRQAEQSFCVFADGSMVDSHAVARSLQ